MPNPQFAIGLLRYITGEAITADGAANVPSEATYIAIAAESGAVYYAFNADFANTNAPGFVADGSYRFEGPIGNIDNLQIGLEAGAKAHIQYYKQI